MDCELRQCLNELHGLCEHLEPLPKRWEIKQRCLQWRNRWVRLTKRTILAVAVAVLGGLVGYNSRTPNRPVEIAVAQPPEIRRPIPVEPEIRKAIPVQMEDPEVDRRLQSMAFITQVQQEEECSNKEIQIHKWNHWTDAGKTFRIAVFSERNLGDRKAEIDAIAKQLGARFYRLWEHKKFCNVEAVKIVFFK
jgi:hypothetical protein